MTSNLDLNNEMAAVAKAGAWNDPDLLEVGALFFEDALQQSV
jgi:hypothetical protein